MIDKTQGKFPKYWKIVALPKGEAIRRKVTRSVKAKCASDVITQTNSDKQNGMVKELKLFSSA